MTTDTQLAPTDDEIDALNDQHRWDTTEGRRDLARAVLARWGTQSTHYSAAEFALQALVAAGHVSQELVDRALALPDAPLSVFSKGPWTFKETGQSFSGAELDEAAFVAYRDRASHGQPPAGAVDDKTAEHAMLWRQHCEKLDALVTYCPTCCQGFIAQKDISRDEVIFECGKTAGREAAKKLTAQATQQAPAQAAPAYKDSTPELYIGDSAFESWYSTYSPAHKSDKQRARDAYAAGMGDPLVTAAPAAVEGPSDPSITLDFKHATELLKMFGGEPGLVTLQHGNERSHSGAGLYAWYSDLPEEGAVFLGAEPDDEAAPTTQPAPQQEAQEPAAVVVPCYTPSGKRVALYSAKHDLPIGTKLYTGPRCAPTAQAAESVPAANERDDFEKVFPLPSGCVRVGTGYASTGYSNWAAHTHCERWQGWQARAARDPAGSVTAECGNCFEGKSDFDHVCKKCRGSGKAADSVLEDAARLDWLLLRISGAEFRRIGVHYSGNARRADVDAARKQGANHD